MDFIDKKIEAYCEDHTTKEDQALYKINRLTNLKVAAPRMLSGHLQGAFLSFISKTKQPKRILEIGTYTGYSAICLSKGLQIGGKLFTIDCNEELGSMINSNIEMYNEQIKFICGDAKKIIPTLKENWDLVFIDADKESYVDYYKMLVDKLKPGSIIIVDNVLWSGKVLLNQDNDKSTEAIKQFNSLVVNDPQVECLMLPIRDGIMVITKK